MFITSINLQNLELFEFMCVLALPNASRMTLDFFTVSVDEMVPDKKSMACFAVFVLPEPETPVINKVWFTFLNFIFSTASLTKIKIKKMFTIYYIGTECIVAQRPFLIIGSKSSSCFLGMKANRINETKIILNI